jgi:cellulose biosynthesis protein BcsQ
MTKDVHFIMQGKGGVGKTLVSVLLTQYLKSQDRNVLCIDTDAVNRSFYRFKTFDVKIIPLLQQQDPSFTATNLKKVG